MPTELELKYTIDDPTALDEAVLEAALAGTDLRLEVHGTVRHADRYYDDPRLSLGRAGLALRRRIGGGRIVATLKSRGRVAGALHERSELELPMEGREWPGPIRDRLSRVTDLEALKGRWELATERRRFRISGAEGELAELSIDRVEAGRPTGGRTVRFAEVEIEDRGGGAEALERIAARIRRKANLEPSAETKLERARRLLLAAEERSPDSAG